MRNRNGESLSNEQIQLAAPSAFAGQAYQGQSDRYAFLPTSVIIEGMRRNGFEPMSAIQSASRIPGKELFTKHKLTFRQTSNQADRLVVGDTHLEAALINSHDGSSLYDLSFGAFRVACENGLMVAEGIVERVRVRHVGNIVDKVIEGTTALLNQAPIVAEAIKLWKSIQLTPAEQTVLAESAYRLRYDEPVGNLTPGQLLRSRRYNDDSADLWTVFNRIQENVIKGGSRYLATNDEGRTRQAKTREVKGIDQNTKLNRELWAIADKMASIKTGN